MIFNTVLGGKSKGNKLPQMINKTITEITADDVEGINKIGVSAFSGCKILTKVVIPDTVKKIEAYAFQNCYLLTSIAIPDSVMSIETGALRIGHSNTLATVTMFRSTPPSIQSSVFDASYIKEIIVPKGSGLAYKNATNWSTYASLIKEAT